jgi:hypothetical protein
LIGLRFASGEAVPSGFSVPETSLFLVAFAIKLWGYVARQYRA